jgi:type IX secretion system PorP/SprF family membrane protein
MALTKISAQGENPTLRYDVPAQNLLKFNRFLINPTFSTVREDKSYINLLHRNQSVSFDDNNQDYFLSYSGRISDRSGVGLSLFTQTEGIVRNYGVLANYAYGIKLSDKSNFTFGANFAYYNTGINRDRISTVDPNDPALNDLNEGTLISFQPGFNLSYGKFDFGLFAENLFDYNISESISNTQFDGKTFSGHLQYTHQFEKGEGILQQGRLMPLARVRMVGQEDVVLGGSLILDLPKLGWIQAGYDDFYGAAAGIGFHLSKRISLGYTMEKGLSGNFDNFGLTHEISFAYSFNPNLTEDRVLLEADQDELVAMEGELEEVETVEDSEVEKLKKALAENNAILEELMFRQDSLEANRQADLERRFDMVMRMVRKETGSHRPDVEEKARKIYFQDNNDGSQALQKDGNTSNIPSGVKKPTQKDTPSQVSGGRKTISKKFRDLKGVENGYYVIANVYRGEGYLGKFVSGLREKGIAADYFTNDKNGLKYVYLNRYDTWKEAVAAYNSNLNGSYSGDIWIMDVDNRTDPRTEGEYVSNTGKVQDNVGQYGQDVLKKNVLASSGKTAASPSLRETFRANGVDAGYYIIANVFSNANNANRFVKLLNSKGLNASYFVNPKNNYRYVYLKKHSSWNNALISYYTKLNQSYDQQMWIMRVIPNHLS